MPTIFQKDGFNFSFIVTSIAQFMFMFVSAAVKQFLKLKAALSCENPKDLKFANYPKAEKLAEENKKLIIEKWNEHLG